ncbi:MAG: tetraacyldisaccharide 4'-kinase [Bacteroidaceae bacterium]|nr:tetraacyldisaccharide 4'-kinase [Bacteroidaceae bacterium]
MEGDLVRINEWLLPLSWLYGKGVAVRNALFDMGILKSKNYDIPIINVGNLTVGGTGKTPHTEHLIRLLSPQYRVAVLSRGYKRKSKGYQLATAESTVEDIGDEPWQMRQKFPDIYIAVDRSRQHGIERLCNDPATRDVDIILLDDAYQHRYVQPGLNILLVDYHRMVTDDRLLPAGRLREPKESMVRANLVVVTKCPHDIKPMGYRVIEKVLGLMPCQGLYFSTFRYGLLRRLFGEGTREMDSVGKQDHVLLLTGIASPEQMRIDLSRYTPNITPLAFPDHHYFTDEDTEQINQQFASLPQPRIIITTEKDATRLRKLDGLSDLVRHNLYVLPVEVEIMKNQTDTFNEIILGYVRKNPRNRSMAQGQAEQ